MLQITDRAKTKLQFFMQDRSSQEWGVQIRPQGSGFHLSLTQLNPLHSHDQLLETEGFKFVFDQALAKKLEEAKVDYVETAWNAGFKVELPPAPIPTINFNQSSLDTSLPQVQKIQQLIKDEINPALESHGGFVELLNYQDDIVYLKMGGGCQGCASSVATMKQGIERRLRQEIPEIREVIDQTDHAAGENPYL